MKTMIKLILAGTALAAGLAQAQTTTPVLPATPGGSNLVLFVTDTATNQYFAQDLGVNLDSLGVTQSSVVADIAAGNRYSSAGLNTVGSLNNPIAAPGILTDGVDTALLNFIHANGGSASNYVYTIFAGATGDGSTATGQSRVLTAYSSSTVGDQLAIGDVSVGVQAASQQTGSWFAGLNAGITTGYGAATDLGGAARSTFQLGASNNGTTLGGATNLYEYASVVVGSGHSAYSKANEYESLNPITVNFDGTITGLSAVPLPAAIWLFGSSLLGLLGISRRRGAAV